MYKYISLILILAIFSGCHKISDNTSNPTTTSPTKDTYSVKLTIDDQAVITGVKHDTLYLKYQENITFLLNPEGFKNASALHLKEDFSAANLKGMDFKILNEDHVYRTNSVDDNLNNNVPFIKASTIAINGTTYTKLILQREFIFYKAYKLPQLAVEAQINFLAQTKDVIGFSAYYYYNGTNSEKTVSTANLVYKKAD
jgi:hypothetical protein